MVVVDLLVGLPLMYARSVRIGYMPSIYCDDCGGEMNIEIDYGANPVDDMINKLKLMGYVVFKRSGENNA